MLAGLIIWFAVFTLCLWVGPAGVKVVIRVGIRALGVALALLLALKYIWIPLGQYWGVL